MSEDRIEKINAVIADYFKSNKKVDWIPAKEIMPDLIKAGIFHKDEKKGLPLRKVLRALDKDKSLDKIPFVHTERNGVDTYWYLVREGAEYVPKEPVNAITNKQRAITKREESDEYYLIGLCNELLKEKAIHQKTFNFLLGDFHKNGKTRTELPLDAYYSDLNLVIEFIEKNKSESADDIDKAEKKTVSGVSRNEQRIKYTQRKREVLDEKQITLIEINYDQFKCDAQNKLVRNKVADIKILKKILKELIKKN